MLNQRGMGTILAVCLISFTLWMGLVLLHLSKTEREISTEFIAGMRAQHLAESGALAAIELLRRNEDFATTEEHLALQSAKDLFPEGKYAVYIKELPDQCVILSIGEIRQVRRQVVVYVKRAKGDSPFTVIRWNNE